MSRLKKVYAEITDVCNLSCSFCHGTKREKKFISPQDFRTVAEKVRPLTEYIYLHLMGEPLLHPRLDEILSICRELDFKVTVTTNGVLLPQKKQLLGDVYKTVVSLHSFEANAVTSELEEYLGGVIRSVSELSKKGVICVLRLWNGGGENSLNGEILSLLESAFPGEHKENRKGLTLAGNVYLEYGEKFDWPDENAPECNPKFCMGLRDHIGVLCDGSVVPCCLDADGVMTLGNLLTEDLEAILSSEKAVRIYNGFSGGSAVSELCRRCGYAHQKFG